MHRQVRATLRAAAALVALFSFRPDVFAAAALGPVQEVVITATLRATPLSELPASASIFTAAQLGNAKVATVKDLAALAPSMGVVNSIGESFGQIIRVRGIATSGADIGLESAAGITVDGVPLSRPSLSIADLQGVERIEFLRGPQGTLHGRSTTAGAITVITARPTSEPALSATLVAGEPGIGEARITANGPIAGNLLGRVDLLYARRAGDIRNLRTDTRYGGRERSQIRAQALWTEGDFNLRLIGDYLHHQGRVNGPVYRVVGVAGPLIGLLGGEPLVPRFEARPFTQVDNATPRHDESEGGGISVEANWQADATVTAILSYRDTRFARGYDVDNSPADIAHDPRDGEQYRTATGELRLRHRSTRFDHLAGVFLSREIIESRDSYTAGTQLDIYANALAGGALPAITGLPVGSNFPAGSGVFDLFEQRATEAALFAHEIVTVTAALSLTAGLRFSHVEKHLSANISSNNPGCSAALSRFGPALTDVPAGLQGIVCIPNLDPRYDGAYETARAENAWSGTAAVAYKVSDALNAYVSYARGYKAGGFQFDRSGMNAPAPALSQLAFAPEYADSYEAGVKAAAPEAGLQANAAVFHTAFSAYQFSYFTGLNRRTTNVPELTTKGIELEIAYRPTMPLALTAAVTYQEPIFGESGFPAGLEVIQGSTFPTASRWILAGTAQFEQALPQWAIIGSAGLDLRWQSAANVGASATPSSDFRQEAYALAGGRIGIAAESGAWEFDLWARNLFDQRAWSILNATTLQPGSISGYLINGRRWGVSATARW